MRITNIVIAITVALLTYVTSSAIIDAIITGEGKADGLLRLLVPIGISVVSTVVILLIIRKEEATESKESSEEDQQPSRAMVIIESSLKQHKRLYIALGIGSVLTLLLYVSTFL